MHISETLPEANVIHINYNIQKFENLKEYHALNEYIEKMYVENNILKSSLQEQDMRNINTKELGLLILPIG